MKLSKEEIDALVGRLKSHTRGATSRAAEGAGLMYSKSHLPAFALCREAMELVGEWDGSRADLEVRLRKAEADISAAMAVADAHLSSFPAGSSRAFGHTGGHPLVEEGVSACHLCNGPCTVEDHVTAVLDVPGDVLLFVFHVGCWTSRDFSDRMSSFRSVSGEEWVLLLAAKDVLSS